MAYIDKIYGTREHWNRLHDWLEQNKPEYIKKYMYGLPVEHFPIANFSKEADIYLMENCPLDFVQERLKEQYPKGISKT